MSQDIVERAFDAFLAAYSIPYEEGKDPRDGIRAVIACVRDSAADAEEDDPGNVTPFTGVTRLPHLPDQILDAARGKLRRVLILGEDFNGEPWRSGSESDLRQSLMDIERFKTWIMQEVEKL